MAFELIQRVYYEDTDAGGVVYYANYLKFLERARTEWLRTLGFEQDMLMQDPGIMFAVRRVEFDYLLPARFNDLLSIQSELTELKPASLSMRQQVRRVGSDELLGAGQVRLACIGAADLRPKPIPKSIIERIRGAD